MLDSFLSLFHASICNATTLLYDQMLLALTMVFRLYPDIHITMAAHDWRAWKRQIMRQLSKMFFGMQCPYIRHSFHDHIGTETNRLDSKTSCVKGCNDIDNHCLHSGDYFVQFFEHFIRLNAALVTVRD